MARQLANTAFINVSYDARYQGWYLAFIAGLTAFGQAAPAGLTESSR